MTTIDYDRWGFRNPDDQRDWVVAIAGDSFVEIGFLRDEELFTSWIFRSLGVAVRNLGASHTGPLTQLQYLRDFGFAKWTRSLVIVFYEGNDLYDLEEETKAVKDFEKWARGRFGR